MLCQNNIKDTFYYVITNNMILIYSPLLYFYLSIIQKFHTVSSQHQFINVPLIITSYNKEGCKQKWVNKNKLGERNNIYFSLH